MPLLTPWLGKAAKASRPAAKAEAKPVAKPAKAVAKPVEAPAASAPKKPRGLKAPRKAGADDLKVIKGIGPKLEVLLHSLGFFHFDQIAAWSGAELAWVDDNLEGFKGRAVREDWVGQARALIGGKAGA